MKDGEGEIKYPDGRSVKGLWQNDFLHGDGVITGANKLQRQVTWYQGVIHPTNDKERCYDLAPLNMFFVLVALCFAYNALTSEVY
jgi:hypothetical protein